MLDAREQSDAVALAVDNPPRPKFPWPFADRTPSFVPKNITPGPIPADVKWPNEPLTATAPWDWTPWIMGFFAFATVGAFVAAAFIRW